MSNEAERKRRKVLYKQQKGLCHWCGKKCFNPNRFNTPKPHVRFTTDHVVPRSRGGPNSRCNVVGACFPCNQLRNTVEQFLMQHRKPQFVVKAQYLPVGFLKFNSVHKMDDRR